MNENEVQVWNYEGAEVRTVQIDGEPWFVLADIPPYQICLAGFA